MINYIDAMEARRSFGSLMDKAFYQNQYTVIKRAKKPVAAIVSYELVESLARYDKELSRRIRETAAKNNLEYDKALALSLEAVNSLYD